MIDNRIMIGSFKELEHGDPNGESLAANRGKLTVTSEDEARLVEYLKSGEYVVGSPQLLSDYFDPEKTIGTLIFLGDSQWVWPSDLSYYVENYRVSLPKLFIDHVLSVN